VNMMSVSPLFWLLDIEAYGYDIGVLKDSDVSGKVLILSQQLWSIIREDKVYSVLIGPGYFKGVAESGNRRVEAREYLSMLMFDPTELRQYEPLPLVDIIKPEVIDPMGSSKVEEIMTIISNLVVEKGNVLAGDRVAKVMGDGGVPTVAHYTDALKRIRVSHISGVQRARFILGGTNRPLYLPFVEWFNSRRFNNFFKPRIMALPFRQFTDPSNIEVMEEWMIVEKAGMGSTGIDGFRAEYESVLDNLHKHSDAYIFDL
jgi:hypothetical protein